MLKVINLNGLIEDCELELVYHGNEAILLYREKEIFLKKKDNYPFKALVKIRIELEELGKKIMCKGSRKDVYPSGMSLIGTGAYLLKMGKQTTEHDIGNIFDEELKVDEIALISEQLEYRNKWIKSIISNSNVLKYLDKQNNENQ